MIPLNRLNNDLVWCPTIGIGYYNTKRELGGDETKVYDESYFRRYMSYSKSPIENDLNDARLSIVKMLSLEMETLCDVGIGNGSFVETCKASGYTHVRGLDVNPLAMDWLAWNKLMALPDEKFDLMTFWDSLEHIENFDRLLSEKLNRWGLVFVSCPIYRDLNHILSSKHFRKDEHCWYWTNTGLKTHMKLYDFECIWEGTPEQDCGREDIGTFVFKHLK